MGKYTPLIVSLIIGSGGIAGDYITTQIGISKGKIETRPLGGRLEIAIPVILGTQTAIYGLTKKLKQSDRRAFLYSLPPALIGYIATLNNLYEISKLGKAYHPTGLLYEDVFELRLMEN